MGQKQSHYGLIYLSISNYSNPIMGSTEVDLWDCNKIILNFFILNLYWVRELIICLKAFIIISKWICCWKVISKLNYAKLFIVIRKVYYMGLICVFFIKYFFLFHLLSIMTTHASSNMHKGTPLIFVEICPPVIFHHIP